VLRDDQPIEVPGRDLVLAASFAAGSVVPADATSGPAVALVQKTGEQTEFSSIATKSRR